jgi:hypothetical protein
MEKWIDGADRIRDIEVGLHMVDIENKACNKI